MSEAMAPDLTEFLQSAAGDFFAIPDSRPGDFESKGANSVDKDLCRRRSTRNAGVLPQNYGVET